MSGWPCTCTHSLSHSAPPRDVANLTTCVMHVRAICGAQAIEAFELALNAQSNYNAFLGRGSALAMMRNVRACQGSSPPPPPKNYPVTLARRRRLTHLLPRCDCASSCTPSLAFACWLAARVQLACSRWLADGIVCMHLLADGLSAAC